MVKPSGWQTVKHNGVIDGNYLYNRCHLIVYELAAENANTQNLIIGTRYLNIQGMLRFENRVADYVHESGNHVLYRVTPIFEGNNLVASGVLMEGYSVEDQGKGIQYCVYYYNVQPNIISEQSKIEYFMYEHYGIKNNYKGAFMKKKLLIVLSCTLFICSIFVGVEMILRTAHPTDL